MMVEKELNTKEEPEIITGANPVSDSMALPDTTRQYLNPEKQGASDVEEDENSPDLFKPDAKRIMR